MTKEAPRGFDFHCHLDLYPDPPAMVASCEGKQDRPRFAVTTTAQGMAREQEMGGRASMSIRLSACILKSSRGQENCRYSKSI